MDRQGTIFIHTPVKSKEKNEGLHRDSGVGQAPESLYQPSFENLKDNDKVIFFLKNINQRLIGRGLKSSQKSKLSGSVKISSPVSSQTRKWLVRLGNTLIVFSLLGFFLTYGPIIKTELVYQINKLFYTQTSPKGSFGDILAQTLNADISQIPDPNFSLIIPKINASSRVVPNVDPSNENEYMAALKNGVAHAKGTYLPGGEGTVFLFAHSTDSPLNIVRYNAVFYLLRELVAGDEVIVYFAGAKHRYRVTDKKIVEPTDTQYLSSTNPLNKELLILQTCWPPGTRFKRLLIFAEKAIPPKSVSI